jgi:exonuclease III
MALNIVSYNLHGFNQGISLLLSLCTKNDIVFVQEHWLYPNELDKLAAVNEHFMCVATSAMSTAMERGIRHGRPYGGVGILINNDLLGQYKCLAKRERFICISLGAIAFVNVYLPVESGNNEYEENLLCILNDIRSVLSDFDMHSVVIGGDFNVDFNRVCCGRQIIRDFMQSLDLVLCDDMITSDNNAASHFTYGYPNGLGSSHIDHFCISTSLQSDAISSFIVDSGDNMSDHLPICISLCLDDSIVLKPSKSNFANYRFRWDKTNLDAYYNCTYEHLSALPVTNDMQYCLGNCDCVSAKTTVDWLYNSIVTALTACSDLCVPRVKNDFFKNWWSDTLNELKLASIESHNMWKACGSPKNGDIFIRMKQVKMAYKNAIKDHRQNEDLCLSNDLHDLLMEKDMINFWRTWNAKIVKPKRPSVIDGETTHKTIAQKFADKFKNDLIDSTPQEFNFHDSEDEQLKLIDVQVISHCLSQMKCGKAPGIDNIETEHLMYAHPILIVQLCVLFNIMLKHCVVPNLFFNGIIIPIVKDKHGDTSDINNYRAITLSPCISKLFEMCLLEQYSDKLQSSPLQFGFKKHIGCSHAIYTLQCVTDYFTSHGSTVNIALLDMSKAFDRVNHTILFKKLVDKGLPTNVVRLLYIWYSNSNAFVRWGSATSQSFHLKAGVRQGGVLSPLLFVIYVDSVINRLQANGAGCTLGNVYVGCILYADDLLLISISVTEMQIMIDICTEELHTLDMVLNANKCCIMRVGCRHNCDCSAIKIQDQCIPYTYYAKYLGVKLRSGKKLTVDLQYMKKKFYTAFNGLFHRLAKMNDELTALHIVSAYCKPHLLYGTECFNLSTTQSRSLCHTWLTAVSHIFNVSGNSVNFINSATCLPNDALDNALIKRRVKFLQNVMTRQCNTVFKYLACVFARRQLISMNVYC